MAAIRFLLNGEERSVAGVPPTRTLLRHLRESERLTGTKEGCAEGDCGACTVVLAEADGEGRLRRRAVNSCITFLPAVHGRAVETVEGLAATDGTPAPIQREMVARHASQCGFCTPGFAVQLHASWLNGALVDRQAVKDELAGNLCRCTGYGPIVEAGLALAREPLPDAAGRDEATARRLGAIDRGDTFDYAGGGGRWAAPRDVDTLADLYLARPDATLVAGATDVALWVTKAHRALPDLIDVSRVDDLRHVEEAPGCLYIGAAVTHSQGLAPLAAVHPAIGALLRRFAGPQVRNAGTVGGNLANASPIGDLPPVLIALGATLHLRHGDTARAVPLERFFLDYGRQDRRAGELVVAVEVPLLDPADRFAVHKVSKRFDSDISAVHGAFRVRLDGSGRVVAAALAFGGMAGIPKRAAAAEAALVGRRFDREAAQAAGAALHRDFTPLDDWRASAGYRMAAAANLLERFRLEVEDGGHARSLAELR